VHVHIDDPGGVQPSTQGQVIEDYARRLAGGLGVPDFVYEPLLRQRRGRNREVGDGLLVAGKDGLIIQVKSRTQSKALLDQPGKAASWCHKHGIEAQRQGNGTRRTLLSEAVRVRSLRGFERTLPDATCWPTVVILDHPADPVVSFEASSDTLFISLGSP
jgi:hypothetical protein